MLKLNWFSNTYDINLCLVLTAFPTGLAWMFQVNILRHLITVSPCTSVASQNEGSCRVYNGVASCFCKGDFTGSYCEGKIKI